MFGSKSYLNILNKIKKKNFIFVNDWKKIKKKNVLLRHDIDFSLKYALIIAKRENKKKIKATYFFMFSSNFYNLFSKHSQKIIFDIKKLGHKISLHFDPTAYNDINFGAKLEIKTFEKLFKTKLDIISIHRPGSFLKQNNKKLCNCSHTYQDKFFKSIRYVSDSGGKNIIKKIDKLILDELPIQILIHPVWWSTNAQNVKKRLNFFLKENKSFLKDEIKLNCKTYKD